MSAVNIDVKFNGSVLVIGTENDTMLTVTVPVTAFITNSSNAILLLLRPGLTYSYKVNRLQILYLVTNIYDLTGARIVTNKPVSVLSGHECGFVSETRAYCSNLAEQMLPTELWGTVHYVAPLASRSRYTIKILATHDATIVHIICTNTSHMYTLNTANFVTYILNSQEFCAIHSSNIILVVQFSHGYNEDEEGAPMMTLIPATIHYTNTITSSTYRNPVPSLYGRRHRNYVNIIVMADYYQPSMIFLKTEGVNQSLESQSWVPIIMNNSTEAYATQVKLNITEGMFEIRHINSTALMTAIVYGFDPFQGYLSTAYGHPGWLRSYLVQVRFNQTSYTIDEDEGAVHPVLVLNNQSSYDIAVQINIITGSATGGIDFDSGPYSIKFPAGVTTVLFDILIIDDQTLEQTETFYLSINSVILPDRVTGITPDQTMITIQDNDIVVVSFNQSAYSVDEDDGLALPVLVVNGSSAVNFTVQVMTTDGSATGGDVDYDSGPYSITFPAGVTDMSFDIFINDDEILEENETFFLRIITLPKGVSTGHLNQTMITVLDDDTISPTGSTLDRSTSQVIITTIAAVIAAIMLVLFFGFCAYKLKRCVYMCRAR
ncbi:uncharacterized protein [Dysidea avara]|uniref:uncharacterized protein n=1 Tax=Dysidea avara TaxID=196820 RepID=UPI0033324E13